jgi:hypothetical protein
MSSVLISAATLNDGLVSRALRNVERCAVGEMEIVRITHGDERAPELQLFVVDGGCARVEFLLQQVNVCIAR